MKKSTPIIVALILTSLQVYGAGSNPVAFLPGMSPHATNGGLPQPVISDLTNYPNPFDTRKAGLLGQTVIAYQLASDSKVSLEIYDLLGHKVRSWNFWAGVNGGRAGANTIIWDGTNEANQKVSKGGYLAEIVIETPETTVTVVRKIGVIH
jgi:hypothetical protein